MRPSACIRVAVAMMLGAVPVAAQAPLETRGAWQIVPKGEDFALRTTAHDKPDTTLSLRCLREHRAYMFEIKSAALAAIPRGEDIRVGYKIDDDDQAWFSLSAGPDGTIPMAHETAFWIIHAAVSRGGAKQVAFTAVDYSWQFSLEGFAGLNENLIKYCKFEPPRSPRRGG